MLNLSLPSLTARVFNEYNLLPSESLSQLFPFCWLYWKTAESLPCFPSKETIWLQISYILGAHPFNSTQPNLMVALTSFFEFFFFQIPSWLAHYSLSIKSQSLPLALALLQKSSLNQGKLRLPVAMQSQSSDLRLDYVTIKYSHSVSSFLPKSSLLMVLCTEYSNAWGTHMVWE